MANIDRELLRDLDRHLRGPQVDAPRTAPEAHMPARADISGVLEAIEFAASSMNATAEHIEQLEAHSQAFEAANQELEAQNRQLTVQLGEAIHFLSSAALGFMSVLSGKALRDMWSERSPDYPLR